MFKDKFEEFKGHFTIQSIDKDGKILDEYIDDNLIVTSARLSIAELFAGLTVPSANKLVIGTSGDGINVSTPKSISEGLVQERTRLFSESIDIGDGETHDILLNDLIRYTGSTSSNGTLNSYYRYTGTPLTGATTASLDFAVDWTDVGVTAEYNYPITFDLPGTASGNMTNISENDFGSTASISQVDRDVTFTFNVGIRAGNDSGTAQITEAGLYANSRLFSIKTFSTKPKDATVILRIIWKISF